MLAVGKIFVRPLAASLGAVLLSVAVYLPVCEWTNREGLGFLAALFAAVIAYAAFAVLFGAVTREDLSLLPRRRRKQDDTVSEQSEMRS